MLKKVLVANRGEIALRVIRACQELEIAAAKESGAEAVHPGYGFLAENASFAAACRDTGLEFVGPSPESIEKMGNKSAARRIALEADVPVVPGSDDAASDDEAVETAEEIGYPVMVKAAAGGGGRGIRVAGDEEELRKAGRVARQEAEKAFGD